jgi:hypothetical protein
MKRPPVVTIGPSIAYVELTQGQYCLIDSSDVIVISGHTWFAQINSRVGNYYAKTQTRVSGEAVRQRHLPMHQLLCPVSDGFVVDHVNGNSLDNRRSNLRLVTTQQNAFNRRLCADNKVGFKGVALVKGGKYQATLKVNDKAIYLGRFATPELAHAAYCSAAKEHFGEFWRAA